MSEIIKPLFLDETGKAIVEALTQREMTKTRIAEINAAADAAKDGIQEKTDEQTARIPEVTMLAEDVSQLKEDIATLNNGDYYVDLGTITTNEYVNREDGIFLSYNGWARTDYIKCEQYNALVPKRISVESRYNAFYDSEYNFVSSFSCYENKSVRIPDGAVYMALSNITSAFYDTVIVFDEKKETAKAIGFVANNEKLLNNLWNGKICACLGTSLTANGGWTDVIKERFGFEKMYNRGSGGTTLADYSNDGFSDYVTSISVFDNSDLWDEDRNTCYYDPENVPVGYETYTHNSVISGWYSAETRINTLPVDADLVLIDLGTNDYFRVYNNLDWDSRFNEPQINTAYRQWENPPTYNTSKFGDAFVLMIKRIQTRCPNARIVVWGMLYNSSICNYNSSDNTQSDSLEKWYALNEYIKGLCKYFGVHFIDMLQESGINIYNLTDYCEDGIHPYKPTYATEKGKYAVANVLTKHLLNVYPKDYES